MTRWVIRADASVHIGAGHVMRCLTLAQQILAEGQSEVAFICRDEPGHLAGLIQAQGYPVTLLPAVSPFSWEADAEQVMQSLNTRTTDWLVVDHYCIDSRWETLLGHNVNRIAVIDDLANRPHDCDAIIDQNYRLGFENRYDYLVPDGCIKLLGPGYLLLRPEFAKARQNLKRDFSAVKRILVNFGGTDEPNLSLKTLNAIQSLKLAGLLVDVVIGQTNPHKAALQQTIKQMPGVTLHVQTDRMAELVYAADLAIGASGASTWERCSLGLPTLALVLADNQREAAGELGAAGIIVNLGESNITTQQLAAEVDRLMKDHALRASLSERSMKLIPAGQASLPQLLMRTGNTMLRFRKMLKSDQEQVLAWRVKPEVAQFMLTQVAFDLEKQLRWFDRINSSTTDEYWIIENNGKPIGVINLSEIDRVNQRATWGLYVGEDMNSPVGGMLPMYFYNYVFGREDLKLHKLHGMVLDINTNMLRVHDVCGYRQVGIHKDHVLRDGHFHDVHVVELLREDWLTRGKRFSKMVAVFEDAFFTGGLST